MQNLKQHTGKLSIVKRLKSSYNGNPRYMAEVDGVIFSTSVDSSLGYCITNYRDKLVKVTVGTHYRVLTLDSICEV